MIEAADDARRFGDAIVRQGIADAERTDKLAARVRGGSATEMARELVAANVATDVKVLPALAAFLGISYVDLSHWPVPETAAKRIRELQARRNRALLVIDDADRPTVGMADPQDFEARERLERILDTEFRIALVSETLLSDAFDRIYSRDEEIASLAGEVSSAVAEMDIPAVSSDEGDGSLAVARLVETIFSDAVRTNTSDIHIQPERDRLLLRHRVDGILREQVLKESRVGAALISRLKLMANLDIAEKRLPQDGRMSMTIDGHQINVRVATMPSLYGENVVMRLLYQGAGLRRLDQLGLPDDIRGYLENAIQRPNGLILVTGPTGSGKTTTLYAALDAINKPGCKIITVEDPVEYTLPRIAQVPINDKAGLNFATVLRATLRHDPDVVMVGEMRDSETMSIGMRAAMTGHLVFSTLHTRNAVATVNRLFDMGAEPYLIASVLNAVISQQLVRSICDTCRWPDALTESERRFVDYVVPGRLDGVEIQRGTGCVRCNDTGYRGRLGLHEVLHVDADLAEAIRSGDNQVFAKAAVSQTGFRSMLDRGMDAVAAGITTVSEVMRVADEVGDVSASGLGAK